VVILLELLQIALYTYVVTVPALIIIAVLKINHEYITLLVNIIVYYTFVLYYKKKKGIHYRSIL